MVMMLSISVIRRQHISGDIRSFVRGKKKCREKMSTERFKNVTSCFVINLLNNKTIILLNLAEYRLKYRPYQTIVRAISQDNC